MKGNGLKNIIAGVALVATLVTLPSCATTRGYSPNGRMNEIKRVLGVDLSNQVEFYLPGGYSARVDDLPMLYDVARGEVNTTGFYSGVPNNEYLERVSREADLDENKILERSEIFSLYRKLL